MILVNLSAKLCPVLYNFIQVEAKSILYQRFHRSESDLIWFTDLLAMRRVVPVQVGA